MVIRLYESQGGRARGARRLFRSRRCSSRTCSNGRSGTRPAVRRTPARPCRSVRSRSSRCAWCVPRASGLGCASNLVTVSGAEPVASMARELSSPRGPATPSRGFSSTPGNYFPRSPIQPFPQPTDGSVLRRGRPTGGQSGGPLRRYRAMCKSGRQPTIPFFGALTSTPETATLQAPLPEMAWFYELDVEGGSVRYQAQESSLTLDLPMDPMHGTVGASRHCTRCGRRWHPDPGEETWTPPRSAKGAPSTWGERRGGHAQLRGRSRAAVRG